MINNLKSKIITDPKLLKNRIDYVKNQTSNQGETFNQIRFVAGTSSDGLYAAIIVIVFFDKDTLQFYFVVVPYNSKSRFNKTKDRVIGETSRSLARKEVYEETKLQINEKDLVRLYADPCKNTVQEGFTHTKYAYLIDGDKVAGNLDDFAFSKANPADINGHPETGMPVVIPASLISEYLFAKHTKPLMEAIKSILKDEGGRAQYDKDYAFGLSNLQTLFEQLEINYFKCLKH